VCKSRSAWVVTNAREIRVTFQAAARDLWTGIIMVFRERDPLPTESGLAAATTD
jgi:hypothetical protein